MPADRTPCVMITNVHGPLGPAIAYRFAREHWFVVGCDEHADVAKFTKAQIITDLTDPDACVAAAATAAIKGNGLDCVIELDTNSLVGDAAVPLVSEMDGCVVHLSEIGTEFASPEAIAEEVWRRAAGHVHIQA